MAFENEVAYGTALILKVKGKIIGCATSHSIDITNSPREIACKDDGGWSGTAYGTSSWSLSADGLVNFAQDEGGAGELERFSLKNFQDLITNKEKVTIISEYVSGTDTYTQTGTAVLTSVSYSAANADNTSYSVSFQGDGAITTVVATA